jgi:alkylation response protein AidB-like acyl-CoA dehydrogenase
VTTATAKTETIRVLRENADQTDQQYRPTAAGLDAIRRSGAFALATPVAYGGAGADSRTVARELTAWGRACPSTAWVAGTCVTSKTLVGQAFSEAVRQEFFADPNALTCGTGVPAGRGQRTGEGVRVSGQWPNVSGCEDATWAVVALLIDGTFSFALIPVADLSIDRTWDLAGMRGTGSHSLVADHLLVPAERVVTAAIPGLNHRLLFGITVLAPVVGAAQGALDVITAMFASDRKPFMTAYTRMGESPAARQWLAEATQLVGRAEQTMTTIATASAGRELTPSDTTRLSMDLADAGRDCRAALERMLDLHGPSGFRDTNALQRYWRDVAVGSRHPHLNPYLAVENLGRSLVDAIAAPPSS